ncbi:S8 family serine peptidase [Brevibacillus sp. TJ4]|uniref:S8 family serine peptidase n=1 Tax=Brevibacillus sp. TJ4 TaxID=3234853 RepID=UPI0037D74F64
MRDIRSVLVGLFVAIAICYSAMPSAALADQGEADEQKLLGVSESGEYIVKLREGVRYRTMASFSFREDVSYVQADRESVLLKVSADEQEQVLESLAADPSVEYIEPNIRMYKASVADEPYFAEQWGLLAIEAPQAWGQADIRAKAIVAVLDTGVDYTHPDLAGRVDTRRDHDYVNGDDDAMDDDYDGHGTHVAGIIAAKVNGQGIAGVAGRADVQILPLKVLDEQGAGYMFHTALAIMDAADLGADVINLSLGGELDDGQEARFLQEAIDYANKKGSLVVAAAGNEGDDVDRYIPASLAGVIAVSAVDEELSFVPFSNKGTSIALSAPGVNIWSTVPGGEYRPMTGTSMAAPFVSGTAALLVAQDPKLRVREVTERLRETAVDLGRKGKDSHYGHGLVNAHRALTYAAQPVIPVRLTASHSGLSLKPGGSASLTITAVYPDQSVQDVTSEVLWQSGDEEIATAENAIVTARGVGKTSITAYYADKKVVIPVSVVVTKLEASEVRLTMKPDGETLLTIWATYGDQTTEQVAAESIVWKSSNRRIATVQAGVVTANSTGYATVSASYGGKTLSIPVRVRLTKLTIEPNEVMIKPGESVPLFLYAYDGNVREAVKAEAWQTSNPRVAVVEGGEAVFKGFGRATLTASYRGETARVSVDTSLRKLHTEETRLVLKPGETYRPVIVATYHDGSTKEVRQQIESWKSSNEKAAIVDQDGTITAIQAGITGITGEYGKKQVKIIVEVVR